MELKLEVVLSSSIKRKKPWPRFCWLGKEKESVFLLDDKRISEINMVSGRTRKKTPKLHPLLNNVVTMASSDNGMWLCGLLVSGELFLWNRDKDSLKSAAGVPEVVHMITAIQGSATRLSLQVSGDGMRVLLATVTGQVYLWECMDARDLIGVRDGTVRGCWTHILPLEESLLPSSRDKEATQHTMFVKKEVMGDSCLSAFVFTSGKNLIITCLRIQWEDSHMRVGSVGYSVKWVTKTYPMSDLTPPCLPVKSRGALVPAFSPDGQLLAIVLNQRQPKATQVLFVSTQNFVSISSGLGGCGSKKMEIPSKYLRSYWVGSVSWSLNGLFLACVLKRGSLLMVSRLGGLLTLTSCGCSVDFGPAHFLPLHPLVTYRPPVSTGTGEASLSSSSLSVRDVLRQRYSVTWHPRLLYLIVSDGYMATVMRVLDRASPAQLLKTLLKDTSKDLQKASRTLEKSQIHVRTWLESVSCLSLDRSLEVFSPGATCEPKSRESILSATTEGATLPLFLQDQGTLGGTKELLEKMQTFLEDDSDLDGTPAGYNMEDGGRLEFASMFDTLHALDTQTDTRLVTVPDCEKDSVGTEKKIPRLHRQLGKIQSKLLTAWAFGMSLGNSVENRRRLLKYALHCVVRFAALLQLISSSKRNPSDGLLHLLKALLSFVPWDGTHLDGPCCLGLMVDLSERLIRLLLTPLPESKETGHSQLSSTSLSTALLVLRQVSESLDHTYSLQKRTIWSSANRESQPQQLWSSDVHHVPLLREEKEEISSYLHQAQPAPQRPSSRLLGVWRWLYDITLQYMEELRSFEGCDGWEEEQQQLSVIRSQIQAALQASGERLEEGPALLSYPGENLFLHGSYHESADTWRSQICKESRKSGYRSVFKETQLCLALLFSLLSQYSLREAQELGDHMARLILLRAGCQKDKMSCLSAETLPCPWLPLDLHTEAACAVVQTLGRFMASYFTNQPLYILPPHHVAVLPPLHLSQAPGVGRLLPLCQEEVSRAVRCHHLSDLWTVDYAQDLLLLGGLLPETVWMAYHLGDWKTAASLSLAYKSYCTDHFDFTRLRKKELHLPQVLEPESIFQVELERLLGNKPDSQEHRDKDKDASFTDPLEGEDWDLLQVSLQEILKASVMAGVNVISSPLSTLMDTAKDLCSCLSTLVPNGLYLPSPPLYCPQPSPNTQDPVGSAGHLAEVSARHKVSGVLQRLLLLLRSARCCRPAAQWYIGHLRRARHLLHKIKKKYSYPSAAKEEKAFPEGLMKFVSRGGYFRRGPNKDGCLDPDTIQTIICFRELCGLCWMLHVRDQLSISCRKYQAARRHFGSEQITDGSEALSACVDALFWVRRFLPFSCFLNAEEMLQDILLSLLSELPAHSLLADMLVQAFPEEEESVRVPLREKYNSLLQRLRQCNVIEGDNDEGEEPMLIVIQDKRRQRRKHLKRMHRHLAAIELHLWEKEAEEEDRGSKHGAAMLRQLSLGTTLSTSTLTDCGFPPVCSDGDTADNTSEAVSPEMHNRTTVRSKKSNKTREHKKKAAVKIQSVIQEESQPGDTKNDDRSPLPVVGTWEFELEDEEYLNFLELFLSYVLEKDGADGGESELPLLKGFSSQLRERELHSLTFDVLTTIYHRQRDGRHPTRKHVNNEPPVFRAGCCYKPCKREKTPELQTSSVWSEARLSKTSVPVTSLPGLSSGRLKGLFGLRQQRVVRSGQSTTENLFSPETSPTRSSYPVKQTPESFTFSSPTSVEAVTELRQGLDPKLEAQFPELGRLLEWMVRWADRRVLLGHHGKRKAETGGGTGGTAEEGVVIRVKASTPAVLTSLSLLQCRCNAAFGADLYSSHIQVPETQWTVAPVLYPEVERNLERENSVDTGYPASANTPIIGPDLNLPPGELSINEPQEETFLRTPVLDQVNSDTQQQQSASQQLYLDDLDVTPEKEGKSSDSEGLEVVSPVSHRDTSENICTPQTSLKLADLEDDMSRSASIHSDAEGLQMQLHPEPQVLPPLLPGPKINAEVSASAETLLSTSVTPTSQHPKTSKADAPIAEPTAPTAESTPPTAESTPPTAESTPPTAEPTAEPTAPTAEPTAEPTAPTQPFSTQTPPMRQRVGEDLVRLVQNINYMSLMEVLGASFSNLQLAQQNVSLSQSNMNFSHPNVPSLFPQPHAAPVQPSLSVGPQIQASAGFSHHQFSQVPPCIPARLSSANASQVESQHYSTRNVQSMANEGGNDQDMKPLSVQAMSPDIQFRESRTLIPPSQGLLATTDSSCSAPVLPPSNESLQNGHAPQDLGLKLLQIQAPASPPQSALSYPPAQRLRIASPVSVEPCQHSLKNNDHSALTMNGEEKRHRSSIPKRRRSHNSVHDPSQHKSQTSDRGLHSVLPAAFPAHTTAPMQGLRLLRCPPPPPQNITFPKLPLPSSSRPTTDITVPRGEPCMIKLLHIDSAPKMMSPQAATSARMTRLISMEELTSSVMQRQNAEPQLLRVESSTESTRRATTSGNSNSRKRQKRREESALMARKTEVTFRPNASIIPSQEPVNDPENEEPPAAGDETPAQEAATPLDLGSFSLLTGQRLLDKAMSTSAELHAFASTCKRPPECHDAFTNTDPASPPALVDKAVSASVTVSSPKSQSSEILTNLPEEVPQRPGINLDLNGHQFISVLDLEDTPPQQDLPLCLNQGTNDASSIRPSSPTSAQLHVLATSVIRSSAATSQAIVTIPEESLIPTRHTDIPEEPSSVSHTEPLSYLENQRTTPPDRADPCEPEVCRAIMTQSVEPLRASSSAPTGWFSSRLSEMDTQLAALQNIADSLEKDFVNSRMLVNTIEKLTPVVTPDVKVTSAIKKVVRMSVPQKARTPQLDSVAQPHAFEVGEESWKKEPVVFNDTYAASEIRDHVDETLEISLVGIDETLGHTGLSDTAEILDELVREGYLSQTDLDFSNSRTVHHDRLDEQQSSWMSQKRVLPEDERRELRIWMRRKQRERLAVYQKHRESLREREHKPFSSSGKAKPKTNLSSTWRSNEEKQRVKLLEQYNQRTHEACSLASAFPTNPPTPLISSQNKVLPAERSKSAPPPGGSHRESAIDQGNLKSRQSQVHLRPLTAELIGRTSEDHRRRLGLHRPVTFLPRDRLSQVTRRGMLTSTRSLTKPHTVANKEQPPVRKMGLDKTASGGTAVVGGLLREQTRMEEREQAHLWSPVSGMNRLLGPNDSNIDLGGLLDEQEDGARAGVSGMEWLDKLSDTGSSVLSKIDWAAIERMVAAEED
ncbi:uncharacterized protein V6R79_010631 [Siganus canaliculatus]